VRPKLFLPCFRIKEILAHMLRAREQLTTEISARAENRTNASADSKNTERLKLPMKSLYDDVTSVVKSMVIDESASALGGHGGTDGLRFESEWEFDDGVSRHKCDGLVFTPNKGNYYEGFALKWKSAHLLTVDFAIKSAELRGLYQDAVSGWLAPEATGCLASRKTDHSSGGGGGGGGGGVGNGGSTSSSSSSFSSGTLPLSALTPVTTVTLLAADQSAMESVREALTKAQSDSREKKLPPSTSYHVVECRFDRALSQWAALRSRPDRPAPNSLRTGWGCVEALAEDLSLSELVELLIAAEPTVNNPTAAATADGGCTNSLSNGQTPDAKEVAAHYDSLQAERNSKNHGLGLDNRIATLRRLNNWAKAALIKVYVQGRAEADAVASQAALEEAHKQGDLWPLRLGCEEAHPPQPPANIHAAPATFPGRHHHHQEQQQQQQQQEQQQQQQQRLPRRLRVLDLACGRGGDISKWAASGIIYYIL
jgi:hypothetical protein